MKGGGNKQGKMTLNDKIEYSIALIRKGEALALKMSDKGYYLGFSGGKDSQVVFDLAKRAGVKFEAVYNATTNDPADNVRFIRTYYPDVRFDVPEKSFLTLVSEKGLPMFFDRWCFDVLKESKSIGRVGLFGVRKDESVKRSAYTVFEKIDKKKENRTKDLDKMKELNFECVSGNDKFMLYPILAWEEKEVWKYIHANKLPINPIYKDFKRVGCMFCPYSPEWQRKRYVRRNPKLFQCLLNALEKYLLSKNCKVNFSSPEDYFNRWVEKEDVETYEKK